MNIEEEISLINDIVLNAIVHGADCGGSYDSNENGLKQALAEWIEAKGLTDYVIQKTDIVYNWCTWSVLQIVEDCI
jgi:hypothetical protein